MVEAAVAEVATEYVESMIPNSILPDQTSGLFHELSDRNDVVGVCRKTASIESLLNRMEPEFAEEVVVEVSLSCRVPPLLPCYLFLPRRHKSDTFLHNIRK